MSAPPLFRLVDERRVSVVRDAAAVRRVLDEDPVGSCMVASRVAEHGIEPSSRHVDELLDERLAHCSRPAGSAQKLLQVLATCRTAPTYC